MLFCNGLILNYDIIMYNKSKIDMVREIAGELLIPPIQLFHIFCVTAGTQQVN